MEQEQSLESKIEYNPITAVLGAREFDNQKDKSQIKMSIPMDTRVIGKTERQKSFLGFGWRDYVLAVEIIGDGFERNSFELTTSFHKYCQINIGDILTTVAYPDRSGTYYVSKVL